MFKYNFYFNFSLDLKIYANAFLHFIFETDGVFVLICAFGMQLAKITVKSSL